MRVWRHTGKLQCTLLQLKYGITAASLSSASSMTFSFKYSNTTSYCEPVFNFITAVYPISVQLHKLWINLVCSIFMCVQTMVWLSILDFFSSSFLMCPQVFMHVTAHRGCMNTVRKFALKEPSLLCILASVCDKKKKKKNPQWKAFFKYMYSITPFTALTVTYPNNFDSSYLLY